MSGVTGLGASVEANYPVKEKRMSDTLQFVVRRVGATVDKLKEVLIKCLRRVSVALNLARRFNAGIR